MGFGLIAGEFHSHPKVVALIAQRGGHEALSLWVRALSYCAEHATDGLVNVPALRLLGVRSPTTSRAVWLLVEVGLWTVSHTDSTPTQGTTHDRLSTDSHHDSSPTHTTTRARLDTDSATSSTPTWRFHDWADANPSGDELAEKRRKKREKQRRWRAGKTARVDPPVDGLPSGLQDGLRDRLSRARVPNPTPSPINSAAATKSATRGGAREAPAAEATPSPELAEVEARVRQCVGTEHRRVHKRDPKADDGSAARRIALNVLSLAAEPGETLTALAIAQRVVRQFYARTDPGAMRLEHPIAWLAEPGAVTELLHATRAAGPRERDSEDPSERARYYAERQARIRSAFEETTRDSATAATEPGTEDERPADAGGSAGIRCDPDEAAAFGESLLAQLRASRAG